MILDHQNILDTYCDHFGFQMACAETAATVTAGSAVAVAVGRAVVVSGTGCPHVPTWPCPCHRCLPLTMLLYKHVVVDAAHTFASQILHRKAGKFMSRKAHLLENKTFIKWSRISKWTEK